MTVKNQLPDIERVAIHQAGHAVAQALVGRGRFEVSHVSLIGDHDCSWRGVPAVGTATIDREALLGLYEFGLVTLAGIAAEERFQAEQEPEEEPLVAISDLTEWQEQAWQVLQDEAHIRLVSLNVMRKLQEWFTDENTWQVVDNIAQELLENEAAQGERLKSLLAPLNAPVHATPQQNPD